MRNKVVVFGLFLVGFVVLLSLNGCGQDAPVGPPGIAGSKGDAGPAGSSGSNGSNGTNGHDYTTSAYTFASNVTCQKFFTGYSAKKQTATSANLRIYHTENCSGAITTTLNSGTQEIYETSAFRATLEGTNATGLTLFVGNK